jgi:uncharacterized protein (TIGR03435 family)
MRHVTAAILCAAACVGVPCLLTAQVGTAQAPKLSFDVVSIKPNVSGNAGDQLMMQPGGRFTAVNIRVASLIGNAYGEIPRMKIVGGPDWIQSDRFDILAKAARESSNAEYQEMMRSLLADRFALIAHMETRDMPVYALVIARADGRLGPGLHKSDIDCSKGRPPILPSGLRPCTMSGALGLVRGRAIPIDSLISNLTFNVSRAVMNQTGLTGYYDIDLSWSPEQTIDAALPSLFTALQEQLGLKLESTHGPVDVLVIDRVEKPKPD